MNRGTIIAKTSHAELLDEWEEIIRDSWHQSLRPLDAAYIWNDSSMLTLIFRAPNNNTHRNTDWFLIDPNTNQVARYTDQARMFADVKPAAGICYTFWYREFWQEMAVTPYNMEIKQ